MTRSQPSKNLGALKQEKKAITCAEVLRKGCGWYVEEREKSQDG